MRKMTRKQKRILIAKLIHTLVNSLTFIGLFALWGSVGALEVGRIEFHQFIVQVILSLGLTVYSRYAHYKLFEEVTTDGEY